MALPSEVHRPNSKPMIPAPNDDVSRDTHKGRPRRVCYGRGTLLSLAELEACKMLPCGFDSSIFGDINHASTGLPNTLLDSDCDVWASTLSQGSWQNTEIGILGRPLLRKNQSALGASAPKIEGRCCHLKRSVAPYQPPSLRKMTSDSGREDEKTYSNSILGSWTGSILNRVKDENNRKDSSKWTRRDQKALPEEKHSCPDEQKENLVPVIISTALEESENNRRLVDKCNHAQENLVSSTLNNPKPHFSLKASTFSDLHYDVEMDQNNNHRLSVSNFSYHSLKDEKKEAGGTSTSNERGEGELHPASSKNVPKPESSSHSGIKEVRFMESIAPSDAGGISWLFLTGDESNLPQDVLHGGEIEKSNQPKEGEDHLSQHQGFESCDTGDNQPSYVSYPGTSKHFLSVLAAGRDKTDPAAESLNLKISGTGIIQDLIKDSTCDYQANFGKEFHSTELPSSETGVVSRLTEYDFLGFAEFSYPDVDEIISMIADEPFITNHESGMPSSCDNQTGSKKIQAGELVSNNENKLKLNSEGGFDGRADGADEICLPNEDSLITLDDLIMGMVLVEKPDVNSSKTELLVSVAPADIVQLPTASNVSHADDASQPRLEARPSPSGSNNVIRLASLDILEAKQNYPQFDHSQKGPRKSLSHHSESQRTCKSSEVKYPNSYSSDRPLYLGFPATQIPDPFLEPYAVSTWIGFPSINMTFPQMDIPRQYSMQPSGLVSGVPLGQMQHDPQNIWWHSYGLNMNREHNVQAGGTSAASTNWLQHMEGKGKQMYPGCPWPPNR